jgi:hypothetical protein
MFFLVKTVFQAGKADEQPLLGTQGRSVASALQRGKPSRKEIARSGAASIPEQFL